MIISTITVSGFNVTENQNTGKTNERKRKRYQVIDRNEDGLLSIILGSLALKKFANKWGHI